MGSHPAGTQETCQFWLAVISACTFSAVSAPVPSARRRSLVRPSRGRVAQCPRVQTAFARHGVRLAVFERNRASTWLLPADVVRAWRRAPALAPPAARAGFFVVVITDSRRLQHLQRRVREAEQTVGGGRDFRLSRVSTRRDNVFIEYPGGAPKNLERLRRILDDV
jgi:hypothetical protein